MFTGIAEELGKVSLIQPNRLTVAARKVLQRLTIGDSIAVNGICLTVVEFDNQQFTVDLMPETVRRSNFTQLRVGHEVNLERALLFGGRLGGHLVQGHIDDVGKIAAIRTTGEDYIVRIEAAPEILRYVVLKGFIAVDGISLTVVERKTSYFEIGLIKITRGSTNFSKRKVGDNVNLEVDIIAKYVEALTQPLAKSVNMEYLQEHGFLIK